VKHAHSASRSHTEESWRGRREESECKKKAEEERLRKEASPWSLYLRCAQIEYQCINRCSRMKFEEALLIRKRRYPSCEEATVESCLGMSTAATNSVKLAASAGVKLEPTASSAETVTILDC